jgi:protein-S-isoprenylcysteine O-methyltransferase Ste14
MLGRNIALTVIVGAALGLTIWQRLPAEWTAMQSAGLGLLIAGFVLWSTARFQLGASFAITAQARQLVSHGLYSKIRNPIYIFGSCVIAGTVLLLGHPLWLLIFVVVIPLQIVRAGKEAAVLEAKYGDQYREYRARTWF